MPRTSSSPSAPRSYEQRERNDARISVTKLGEYMVAPPLRRRRLIADQKRPKDFIVPFYSEAVDAMAKHLVGGASDDEAIEKVIGTLNRTSPTSEWDERRAHLCTEALEHYLDVTDEINLDGLDRELGSTHPEQLPVAGVSISVRPEVVLRREDRNGRTKVGAIKLYLSKNHPLGRDAAGYIGAVVHRFVSDHLADEAVPNHRDCLVIDVFDRKVYTAPRSHRRRFADIEAACEEIARAWPAA